MNRGLNEESRETEDSMRNRAHINAKWKQDANRIKKIDGSSVLRRDRTKKKRKVWMENGATKECEARLSCPTAERKLRRMIQVSVKSR